jgi:hypothetical protein
MGRTATSKYAVSVTVPGYSYSLAAWRCKQSGRPTEANLTAYIEAFEASTRPGGANAHLGEQRVTSAYIKVNEYNGRTVAKYQAPARPMFTVVTGTLLTQGARLRPARNPDLTRLVPQPGEGN